MLLSVKPIVIPVEFSGETAAVVRRAQQMTSDPTHFHLLHVMVPIDDLSPGVLLGDCTQESRTGHVRKRLGSLAVECIVSYTRQVVLLGSLGLAIADCACNQNADVIVIPTCSYHGIKRLVLGSVGESVIRNAKCGVLVLRCSDAE